MNKQTRKKREKAEVGNNPESHYLENQPFLWWQKPSAVLVHVVTTSHMADEDLEHASGPGYYTQQGKVKKFILAKGKKFTDLNPRRQVIHKSCCLQNCLLLMKKKVRH